MGDSVQPRKSIALGMFAVTVSISASKRASIHLPKIFLCHTPSLIVKVAFTKCHKSWMKRVRMTASQIEISFSDP